MALLYTDDPVADFLAYDREQQEWLDSLPKCAHCKEPIQDEKYYMMNEKTICRECIDVYLDEHFLVYNEAL